MFQYTQAELDAQVAAMPMLLQLWLNWMMIVVVLMPILFFRRKQGRVAIASSILLIIVAVPVSRMTGISNLLSLVHLLIWTPLVAYFLREIRLSRIPIKTFFGIWSIVMLATCIISLIFDVRDFTYWIMGARGVITPPAEFHLPWITLIFIAIALVMAGMYMLGKLPKHNSS